ncbi:MAG: hypothetical protein U0103_18700 [Candidatus Obscuribacterales bacterium]
MLADNVTRASAGNTEASHLQQKSASGTATIYSDRFNERKNYDRRKVSPGQIERASQAKAK